MKTETYQTPPKGRSTKVDKAGLSLLRPRLINIIADNYVYFNEILQNIYTTVVNVVSRTVSPFIARLTQKKFSHASITTFDKVINIKIEFILKRPFSQPPFQYFWFNRNLNPWNY